MCEIIEESAIELEYSKKVQNLAYVLLDGNQSIIDRSKDNRSYTIPNITKVFRQHLIMTKDTKTGNLVELNPIDIFIEDEVKTVYDGLVFHPAKNYIGAEFNTFQEFDIIEDNEFNINPFIEYVNKVGCSGDDEVAESIFSFFSKIVQYNITKYSALSIVSDEDELVTLLLKGFRKVLEKYYFRINTKKQLTGINTLFKEVLVAEIDDEFLQDKGSKVIFEELVKEKNFPYQVKNGQYETKPNYTSCIVTSRNMEFISQMAKKNMLIVAEVSAERAEDFEYLDSIRGMIDDDRFVPSLLKYLSEYKINETLLKRPPVKQLSDEAIEEGFSTIEKWFYRQLVVGKFENVAIEHVENNHLRVSSRSSLKAFQTFAKKLGDKTEYSDASFGTKISKFMKGDQLRKTGQKMLKHDVSGEKNAVVYGSLSKCRKAFEVYTGLKNIDWAGEEWIVNLFHN